MRIQWISIASLFLIVIPILVCFLLLKPLPKKFTQPVILSEQNSLSYNDAIIHLLPSADSPAPIAVATFESLGVYWNPEDGSIANTCTVYYRPVGTLDWKEALELWYDDRTPEYRGSIVGLTSNTTYEVKLTLKNGTTQSITDSTWNEQFPIGKTTYLPETSNSMLTIKTSGTEDAYHLYTASPGETAVIDVNYEATGNITINASYVIIRGVTLKNGRKHGIILGENAHHVVIEECDISGWGGILPDGWGEGKNVGVFSEKSSIHNIVIQRNRIHHPKGDTNTWSEPRPSFNNALHPEGPVAISLIKNNQGNNVIRYNEIYSDFEHMFNDGIAGGDNFSTGEFPGRDSDIYGNIVTHVWDNPLEIEGGGMNVRVWSNYTDNSRTSISIVPVSLGPLYIFRNVTNKCYADHSMVPDPVTKFIKAGNQSAPKDRDTIFGGGRVYLFHNTTLQEPGVDDSTQGCGFGIGGVGPVENIISRNNIFCSYSENNIVIDDRIKKGLESKPNDFDYDLYNGQIKAAIFYEVNGIKGVPIFDPSNGNMYDPFKGSMKFALSPGSKGYDAGAVIKNFNDNFTGKAPDIGAFEASTQPMEFGVNAYR